MSPFASCGGSSSKQAKWGNQASEAGSGTRISSAKKEPEELDAPVVRGAGLMEEGVLVRNY